MYKLFAGPAGLLTSRSPPSILDTMETDDGEAAPVVSSKSKLISIIIVHLLSKMLLSNNFSSIYL